MVDTAQQGTIHRASVWHAGAAPARVPLGAVDNGQWRALAQRAIEPNGYYLPAWELAVSATARGRTNALALPALDASSTRLIGLMPVFSLWRAWKIPLPALVSAHPYGTLCSPLLDRDAPLEAAAGLLQQARETGAHALVVTDIALDGAAMASLEQVLRRNGLKPRLLNSYIRASLDATQDGETLLRDALGAKKLKELRRQRHRLEEHGPVVFEVARSTNEISPALETFLQLEASGWKGKRGTALVQHAGDAAFIRRAVPALAETAQCEIVTLRAGTTPVAAGIVLRHQDRAFFFKLGIDERFAKYSPGVQLTLDLTRHLCADPAIASADSTASADHPMINPIWRERFAIGDVLIPLRRNDPLVALIHAALAAHSTAYAAARRAVRLLRR
ncbi:GNAT family N-acetyltransferase [Bradyrhizobium sp. LMG 9283]|uniref:GNAT family N-acetyltransferase n=1 Tax=Bradyrhizobium sp. LMG 9283 TaxID=592064 RepID=UPI00388F59C5